MSWPRWSVGTIAGARGAGLGNEIKAYAKAYLGAQAFDARLVHPPWSINPRPYRSELGTSRLDALPYAAAIAAPSYDLTWDRFQSTGLDDYWEACVALRDEVTSSRKPVVRHSSMMRGGFLGIRRARAFLQGRILSSAYVASAGLEFAPIAASGVVVGVHCRAGDFGFADLAPGVFNARIPRDWQVAMVESFVAKCPAPVSVVVCGDESTSDVVETLRGVLPAACSVHEGSAAGVADLARLAWSDLVIPSVSSFSLTASFLGDGLYCWPLEHLHESGGWRSIWGFEPEQEGGPTSRAQDVAPTNGRGIAQSSSPHWPDWAIEYIVRRAQLRQRESDLIYYGVVRDPSSLSAERRDS